MRLRDLLARRRRRTTSHTPPTLVPAGVTMLFPGIDSDSWRSPLCQSGGPVEHARCRHAANRARFDGCSCGCHAPTSYDDGGDA